MKTAKTRTTGEACYVAERADVVGLKVGDMALDPFGKMRRVVSIYAQAEDVKGRAFVCYYTENGENSSISGSMKAGERIAYVCRATAAEMEEAARRAV